MSHEASRFEESRAAIAPNVAKVRKVIESNPTRKETRVVIIGVLNKKGGRSLHNRAEMARELSSHKPRGSWVLILDLGVRTRLRRRIPRGVTLGRTQERVTKPRGVRCRQWWAGSGRVRCRRWSVGGGGSIRARGRRRRVQSGRGRRTSRSRRKRRRRRR